MTSEKTARRQRSLHTSQTLFNKKGKVYKAMMIQSPEDLSPVFQGAPFCCLVWDHEGRLQPEERKTVAARLLDDGCRYAVCAGEGAEGWHDVIDEVYLRQLDPELQGEKENYLITTWHEGEVPPDVAFFFVFNATVDERTPKRFLVLHVGDGENRQQLDDAIREFASS